MSHSQAVPSKVAYVTIGPEGADQRIDNFLRTRLKGVPKTRIYRLLRRGEVRVNRGRVQPAYRLKAGDQVRIPPVTRPAEQPKEAPSGLVRELGGAIVYEDDGVLALNKPAGIPVHGGTGVKAGVIEALRALRPETRFLELVHRLDRETSGILLVAKKRSRLKSLHADLREGRIRKRYELLCAGAWRDGPHRVTVPLQKNHLRSGERVVRAGQGQSAETRFHPRMVYHSRVRHCSHVDAEPITGRTHQIRVHAAEAGHPIAGDPKYGHRDFNQAMKARGLKRMFLHASILAWPDTAGGYREVRAPLPDELQAVLNGLATEYDMETAND